MRVVTVLVAFAASFGGSVSLGGCASPEGPQPPLGCRDGVRSCVDLRFVAHQDDDLLFMNPDVVASIVNGDDVTTVYLTAGTSADPVRLTAREAGILNAYSYMVSPDLAVTDPANRDAMLADWALHDGAPIELMTSAGPRHAVQYDFASSPPAGGRISIVFVRLAERNLSALWDGTVATNDSVACPSDCVLGTVSTSESYDRATLIEMIEALMTRFENPQKALAVSTLDATELYELGDGYGETWIDNSDHVATGLFVTSAFVTHLTSDGSDRRSLDQYRGYDIGEEPGNLGDETLEKRRAFYRYYALGEQLSYTNLDADNPVFTVATYNHWTRRKYDIPSETSRAGKLRVGDACLVTNDNALSLGDCTSAPRWQSTKRFQLQLARDASQCVELDQAGMGVIGACSDSESQIFIDTNTGQIRTQGAQCLHADNAGVRAMPCDKLLDESGNPLGAPIPAQAWSWAD